MIEDMFTRLSEHFDVDAISWRVGSTTQDKTKGMALAYLDARDVMDRFDLVCGPDGWQCRYTHVNGTAVCEIGVRVTREIIANDGVIIPEHEWVWKADGAGATDVEAEKGALSDAFKRAAVRFGVGRYLYGLKSPWVALEAAGRSYKIKDSEYTKLRSALRQYTGVSAKSAAQAGRDKDLEYFREKLRSANDMEALGAIGREIKEALPSLPASNRDPLHDLYAERREEIMEAPERTAA